MRLSLRLIGVLLLVLTVVSLVFSYYEVRSVDRALRHELARQGETLAEGLEDRATPLLERGTPKDLQELQTLIERSGSREQVAGIVVFDAHGTVVAATRGTAQQLSIPSAAVIQARDRNVGGSESTQLGGIPVQIYALPLHRQGRVIGELAIIHDASYIQWQRGRVWRRTFLRILAEGLFLAIAALLIIRLTVLGPIARTAQWIRALRTGKVPARHQEPDWELFRPLAHEVTTFAESLNRARAAAEVEARLRQTAESVWTTERLAVHVRNKLNGTRLFVLANREPYMHRRHGKEIEVIVPASGLVTALEPILRACDGTWVAHGSGDADRETVDPRDRLRVPPEEPKYTLRRVWLTPEEEEGYYFGFANEGLWPLCHIAHTRPTFRAADWKWYQEVNRRFVDAMLEEMADTEQPVVLVQDYHFALAPRMIKQRRPDARVAIFWHIPWPNPEAFGICPWQRELLDGLLGADLVSFHVQSHCDNFLETVDRSLESRVEWEHFSVVREGHTTTVRPFPISVVFNDPPAAAPRPEREDRAAVLQQLGSHPLYLGVGVDRVDYTKGILERFQAVERFLEKYPRYQGDFTFVQIGAPSRTRIKRYHDLLAEVEAEAERINARFHANGWKAIVLLKRHHNHQEIERFYRAADLCLVTSLHDGMNLVAKEFIAARDDEQGMLILSRFTGASRELRDALIVNPYDIDQVAEAIRSALEMDPQEKRVRMQHLRRVVKEQNIYRWAGDLIAELCNVRLDAPRERSRRASTPRRSEREEEIELVPEKRASGDSR